MQKDIDSLVYLIDLVFKALTSQKIISPAVKFPLTTLISIRLVQARSLASVQIRSYS